MSNVRAWLSGGHVHFLQLATRLTEVDTPQADIDQDNVSLAGVLQGAVATELVAQSDTPVFARDVVGL